MTDHKSAADHASLNHHTIPPVDTTWVATTEWALIALDGPDAVKFLQGQVTCDVRELNQGVTRLGAQCTPKGRMLFSFRALQPLPERILLRVHTSVIEAALQSLGKYIVFSKAKLTDCSTAYRPIVVHGPHARALIEKNWGSAPLTTNEWVSTDGNFAIKTGDLSFECWLANDQTEEKWAALANDAVIAERNSSTLLAIRQGLGEVRLPTRELFTPQALNFQLVNAISFRKGCYTGQEIVARLHYRGTLKRHMYRMEFLLASNEDLPEPGSPVISEQQKNIGEIVMTAHAGPGIAEALVVITDEHVNHAALPGLSGKKLSPLPLPYAIPTEDNN